MEINMSVVADTIVKYWAQWQCALFAGALGWMWKHFEKRLKKDHEEQAAIKGAILALLRDRIFQSCQLYIGKGEITVTEREVLEAMFEEYFALGGNGVVKHLKGEVDELPTTIKHTGT